MEEAKHTLKVSNVNTQAGRKQEQDPSAQPHRGCPAPGTGAGTAGAGSWLDLLSGKKRERAEKTEKKQNENRKQGNRNRKRE